MQSWFLKRGYQVILICLVCTYGSRVFRADEPIHTILIQMQLARTDTVQFEVYGSWDIGVSHHEEACPACILCRKNRRRSALHQSPGLSNYQSLLQCSTYGLHPFQLKEKYPPPPLVSVPRYPPILS